MWRLSLAASAAAAVGLSLLLLSSSSAQALRPSRPSIVSTSSSPRALLSAIPRGGGNAKAEHAVLSVKGGGGKKGGKKEDAAKAGVASNVGGGTASMTNLILNLVKAVVGVGVMSLPQGITSFGDAPSAVLPAALLVALMGTTSAYGFSLIGRTCAYTGSSSYRQAWDRAVSEKSSWTVAVACAAKGFFAVLAYSMGLADTFRGIFQSLGRDVSRTNSLLLVTALFLLPLCSLKNLSALAPFSLLGILAMLFAGAAMGVRYLGGDYAVGAAEAAEGAAEAASTGGKYLADLAAEHAPKFGTRRGLGCVFHPNVFVFVCMLSTAFMAHFNAPKFYLELENNTVSRFNTVVSTSFAASVVIQAAIMAVGYLTFGANSAGLVLNNYSPKDALISVARIAVAFSVVFTYPMPFAGCRDGVLDLMNVPQEKRTDAFVNTVTVTLLGLVTMAALKLTDISFVLGFGGATLGNALIYVFPGIMFRGAMKAMVDKAEKDGEDTKGLKREASLAAVHALLGVVLGTLGAVYAVKGVGGGH